MNGGNPQEVRMGQATSRQDLEAAIEAVAARERRRQSVRAVVIAAVLFGSFFAVLIVLNIAG